MSGRGARRQRHADDARAGRGAARAVPPCPAGLRHGRLRRTPAARGAVAAPAAGRGRGDDVTTAMPGRGRPPDLSATDWLRCSPRCRTWRWSLSRPTDPRPSSRPATRELDVVLMDLNLPTMSGVQATAEILALPSAARRPRDHDGGRRRHSHGGPPGGGPRLRAQGRAGGPDRRRGADRRRRWRRLRRRGRRPGAGRWRLASSRERRDGGSDPARAGGARPSSPVAPATARSPASWGCPSRRSRTTSRGSWTSSNSPTGPRSPCTGARAAAHERPTPHRCRTPAHRLLRRCR